MTKTSKQASEFADMMDAITRAMRSGQNAFDFLADLHEAGFMVVSADATLMDAEMMMIDTHDDHVTSLLNEHNIPPAPPPATRRIPFFEWMAEVRKLTIVTPGDEDRDPYWTAAHLDGVTPEDAASHIPF